MDVLPWDRVERREGEDMSDNTIIEFVFQRGESKGRLKPVNRGDWGQIVGVGMVAGVGFTVSIFIAGLAFEDPRLVDDAKIGILVGSGAIGVAGLALLRILAVGEGDAAKTAAEGDPDFS